MQGIIATPSGDIWAADMMKSQSFISPRAIRPRASFCARTPAGDPLANPCKLVCPFALADRPAGPHLGHQHPRRPRHALPRFRPHQSRNLQGRLLRQRPRRRQSGQCLDHQQVRQFRARPPEAGRRWRLRRRSITTATPTRPAGLTKVLVDAMAEQKPGWEGGSMTVLRPDGTRGAVLASLWQGHLRSLGGFGRRQRQHLDFQLRQRVGRDRGVVRLPHRELPARHEDRRCDFAAGRLCRRRVADAGRRRHRSGRRRLGHQQLAGSPRLLGKPDEAVSTLCAGQGVVVFFGMAKPVRTPLIGPPRAP